MARQSSDIFQFNTASALAKSGRRLKMGDLFIAMAVLLIVTTAVTFWIDQRAIHFDRAVLQVHSTIDSLDTVLSDLKDAENSERAYLLTGIDDRLSPYRKSAATLPTELNDLDARAQAGYLAQEDVDALRRMEEQELAELDRAVQLAAEFGEFGISGSSPVSIRARGKMNMDGIRALIRRMIMQKEQDAIRFEGEAETASYARAIAFAGTTVVNLLFLLWAFNRIKREIRQRESAAESLARQQQLTAVTLASIADGVIVTDDAGDIIFMNQVAEKLTGWLVTESLGRSSGFVFRIVDQTTRKTIPNPIESVLQPQSSRSIEKQARLLRKDGSDVPIYCNALPRRIRGDDGSIHGVVRWFSAISASGCNTKPISKPAKGRGGVGQYPQKTISWRSSRMSFGTPLTPRSWSACSPLCWEQDGHELPRRNAAGYPGHAARCVELETKWLIDDPAGSHARIVRGKLALHCEVVDVHTLVEAVTAMYRAGHERETHRCQDGACRPCAVLPRPIRDGSSRSSGTS